MISVYLDKKRGEIENCPSRLYWGLTPREGSISNRAGSFWGAGLWGVIRSIQVQLS